MHTPTNAILAPAVLRDTRSRAWAVCVLVLALLLGTLVPVFPANGATHGSPSWMDICTSGPGGVPLVSAADAAGTSSDGAETTVHEHCEWCRFFTALQAACLVSDSFVVGGLRDYPLWWFEPLPPILSSAVWTQPPTRGPPAFS